MTATVTSDFREEYEAERLRWLRKRFLWYTGLNSGLGILSTLVVVTLFFQDEVPGSIYGLIFIAVGLNLIGTALYVSLFFKVRQSHRTFSRDRLVAFVTWLIILNGLIQLPASIIGNRINSVAIALSESRQVDDAGANVDDATLSDETESLDDEGDEASEGDAAPASAAPPGDQASGADSVESEPARSATTTLQIGAQFLSSVFVTHLLASLFIPWTPREAVRPLIPLLALFAIITLFLGEQSIVLRVVWVVASPLVGLPGILWCAWRASRFRDRFHSRVLRRSYREMKRELVDARRIHEDLFPAPITDGAVHFIYKYEPMRQIGGDFLYAHRFPGIDGPEKEPLSVVMIDVTGHGIPAALTVNRLYGELERLYAEEPDIRPGDVLAALNSYVHYTLATHSVYATALCIRVNPDLDVIEWASGGHPPAFLRSVDGRIDRLDSTAFVLGACHGNDFKDGQQSAPFKRGDTLIAYTDGAIEARDANGKMMGLEGFLRMVATIRPDAGEENGWASAILRRVEQHRFGPPADDTLIVELFRPLRD